MTTAHRVWLTPDAHDRLRRELAQLRKDSADPADEASADSTAVAVRRAQQGRIQQIHDMLMNAVIGEEPPNGGIDEPGMVVTVRYEGTADSETFLLGTGGADYGGIEVYSVDCPLGRAISGAATGDRRTYALPDGTVQAVVLERAMPYGLH